MKNNIFFLCMLFFFTGCSSHIHISMKGCPTTGSWNQWIEKPDFMLEEKVWSFVDRKDLFVANLLKDNKIDCPKIRRVNFKIISTPWDVMASLVPFFDRSTVQIRGVYEKGN